jgi:hypothetical protein
MENRQGPKKAGNFKKKQISTKIKRTELPASPLDLQVFSSLF